VPAQLRLLQYVGPLAPGEYRLRILYHDQVCIAPPEHHDARVVSTSEGIALHVTPRRISTTAAEQRSLRARFAALEPEAPVLLLDAASAGTDLGIDHPTTDAEHILAASWHAVPVLLDAIADEDTSVGQRAWGLALLYDITGLVDPGLEPHAIGAARMVGLPRHIASSDVHILGSWGARSTDHPPAAADQARLIEQWRSLRGLIEVIVN
jgi:hypothetical protein